MIVRYGLLAVLMLLVCATSRAHEVRPAYLEIAQSEHGYRVLWKQPAMGAIGVRLVPHLSGGALDRSADEAQSQGDSVLRVWNVRNDVTPLEQQSINIEGLDRTITDVFVKVVLADGREWRHVLTPERASTALSDDQTASIGVPAYLRLGIEHILTGFDHLLFVLGFVLLVRRTPLLVKTVTAFTVAHSVTLAATALNVIHPRPAVIETLVALSIALLAVEIVRSQRGAPGMTARYPWLIAGAFGLLHGAAFAGALLDIGLPRDDVVPALFLFNVGVECGQLLFIVAVLLVRHLWQRASLPQPGWARLLPAYAIGAMACAWTIERLTAALVLT
ncbi:MAG TPA: HupE/UreJ family protein [Steroidobacteraceae bacterium]|nr:HupE/UreJ family protein [Steroidobacteraceae bacterium]